MVDDEHPGVGVQVFAHAPCRALRPDSLGLVWRRREGGATKLGIMDCFVLFRGDTIITRNKINSEQTKTKLNSSDLQCSVLVICHRTALKLDTLETYQDD